MLSFFPRAVLDEILNLIESVSEGFPSYSHLRPDSTRSRSRERVWLVGAVRSGRSALVGMSQVVTRKSLTCQKYSCSGRVVKWSGSNRVLIV